MAFPDVERVIYEHNPLREVVCQLRFPPILRIDAESPVQFQDLIRAEYPFYQARPALRLPPGVLPDMAQMIAASLPMAGQKAHVFESKDKTWNLSLSREILGLACRKYERWEI